MCYLISVLVLDFDGNLSEHFRPYNLVASPTRNPTVLRALPGMPYDITDGHCSCAFYGMPDAIDRVEAQLTEARERYQKTGWSQTKIDRALEGKSRSLSRRARTPAFEFSGALGSLVGGGAEVRLLCHSYTGRFGDEAFDVAPEMTMALESPAFERSSYPEDVVIRLGRE